MLKFLRKYNLIIMVIGGSLLMVVFLLQPILTRLSPDPSKRKAAMIGDTTITRGHLGDAANDINILGRFLPFLVSGLALDPDDKEDHYLLLLHEAKESGLVGEAGDAVDWLPELAAQEARVRIGQGFMRQGYPAQYLEQILSQPQIIQQAAELATNEVLPELVDRRLTIAQGYGSRGAPVTRVDQAIANARGITRLRARYNRALRLSSRVALEEATRETNSAVADIITLSSDLYKDEIPEPTEAQLQAHFDEFGAEIPGSGDMGFGYRQAPSIKLAWLTLDPATIGASLELDAIEIRKRYAQDRDRYPGEFAVEKLAIEIAMRQSIVEGLMVEADSIIRREVLAATRRLEVDSSGYRVLPDNWNETRPRLPQISSAVQEQIGESQGITVPLPEVQVRNADWLTSEDINQITTIGRAGIRVGAQRESVLRLPAIVRENETGAESPLLAQVGVPLVESPAVDAAGRRYYFTILDARPESPPDSLADVREQVLEDVRDKLAYERLISEQDRFVALAQTDGLAAIEALFATNTEPADPENPEAEPTLNFGPKVDDMVRLSLNDIRSLVRPRLLDNRLQQASSVREPIIDAAIERLDPTAPIGASPQAESIVSASDTAQRVLVVAQLKAFRPLTLEEYRMRSGFFADQTTTNLLVDAIEEDDVNPFGYDALRSRLNYVRVADKDDEQAEAAAEPEAPTEG